MAIQKAHCQGRFPGTWGIWKHSMLYICSLAFILSPSAINLAEHDIKRADDRRDVGQHVPADQKVHGPQMGERPLLRSRFPRIDFRFHRHRHAFLSSTPYSTRSHEFLFSTGDQPAGMTHYRQEEGAASFDKSWDDLMACIASKSAVMRKAG